MTGKIRSLDLARTPTEDALLAYVDGQLDPHERASVESYLARQPEEALRIEAYRRQNRLLHTNYDAAYAEPLPPEIRALTQQIERRLRRRSPTLQALRFAAAMLLAAVVGAIGWEGYRQVAEPERLAAWQSYLEQGVRLAFDERRDEPTDPIPVRLEELPPHEPAPEGTTVPDSSGRAPDLRLLGLQLVSARMLADDKPGAMELIYESENRARVMLYFSPSDVEGSDRFSMLQEGSLSMLFWHQRGRSFGLISELGRDELLTIGTAVQEAWRDQPAPEMPQTEPPASAPGNGEPSNGGTPDTSAS